MVARLIEGVFVNYTYQQLKDNGKDGGELQNDDIFLVSRGNKTLVVNLPISQIKDAIATIPNIEQSKQEVQQLTSTMQNLQDEFTKQTKSINQLTSLLQNMAIQYSASNQVVEQLVLDVESLGDDVVKLNVAIKDISVKLENESTIKSHLDGVMDGYNALSRVVNQTSGMLQSTSAESKKASQDVAKLVDVITQVQLKQESFTSVVNIINQMGGLLTNAAPSI